MEHVHGFRVGPTRKAAGGWRGEQAAEPGALYGVVRGVRLRWRLRHALFGASLTIAFAFVALVLSSFAMDALKYGGPAVLVFRVLFVVAVAAMAVRFVARPLMSPASDDRVALYVEEHEPSLEASLLTAVELDGRARRSGTPARSPALAKRLLESVMERVRGIDQGRTVGRRELRQTAGLFAAVCGVVLAGVLLGPQVLRHGARLLLLPWDSSRPLSLYAVLVAPGNATVARGGDELITARLMGFQAPDAELLVRLPDSVSWSRLPMKIEPDSGRFAFRLLNVERPLEYAVESNGVRSPVFRLSIADFPYTKQLDLEYRFPAYTGLEPQTVENGGDIAALAGTLVRVRVTPTIPATSGRLIVDGGDTLRLVPTKDGALIAVLRVSHPGFYKVELEGPDQQLRSASLDYNIDVIPDRPPTISFAKPGADQKVLGVDEVYTEVRASDDYGVQHVELFYTVNGGAERQVKLFDAGARHLPDMSAGYTFMLEDYKLQPGDVVSYYAKATDNDVVDGPHTATSDIYFMEVRPYEQDYRQDQSGGGGGGGGQQQDNPGQLVERERQIIAGTFKTQRDSAITPAKERGEDFATLRLSQQRLREQVEKLANTMVQRGIASQDSNFMRIATLLPQAAAEMDSAEKRLGATNARDALPPEQRALQSLQRAYDTFRNVRLSMGGGGGGGGGGGAQQQRAQDLADLFEMNKDKLRNQYETLNRGGAGGQGGQQGAQQVDETLERLRQLAARQQQENERAMRKMDSLRLGSPGSSGGAGERQLAQQADEAARQLEKLARERSSPSLADAARRLQEASDAMKRSASQSGPQSAAAGRTALDRLNEAKRLLDQQRSGTFQSGVADAANMAKQLEQAERQVDSTLTHLGENGAGPNQQLRSLMQTKQGMASAARELTDRVEQLSSEAKRQRNDAAGKLDSAAAAMREPSLATRLGESASQLPGMTRNTAKANEEGIGAQIAGVSRKLQEAATQAQSGQGDSPQQRMAQALDKTQELVRGLQSMQARLQDAGSQGSQGAQGKEGSQSNQGQQGRQGQRASQGQSGQSGQQGQSGQSGQQGRAQSSGQGQGQGQGQSGSQGQAQGQAGGQGQSGGGGQNQSQANGQGGRGGSPGQGQNGGQPNGERQQAQGGQITQPGPTRTLGGGGSAGVPNGFGPRLSPAERQQVERELRERTADAEALRGEIARQGGVSVAELDRAIEALKAMADQKYLADPRASADLRAQTLEGLKTFEYDLRRAMGAGQGDDERLLAGRAGEVPEAYKQAVEQYYRSLSAAKHK